MTTYYPRWTKTQLFVLEEICRGRLLKATFDGNWLSQGGDEISARTVNSLVARGVAAIYKDPRIEDLLVYTGTP